MGEAGPIDPDDGFESDETRAAAERARARESASVRPDWLVGADIGEAAERSRVTQDADFELARPTLLRPEAEPGEPAATAASASPVTAPTLGRPAGVPAPAARAPEKPVAWTAAASSLPTLRVVKGSAPAAGAAAESRADAPATPRDAPGPDARFASPPRARIVPVPRLRAAPQGESDERERAFPDDATPAPTVAVSSRVAARPRPSSRPTEAWWIVVLDALRADRRAQLLAGLGLVLAAAVTFWPRAEPTISLGEIRRDPRQWDRRAVRVGGKVGEVYPVGGGFAFYIHQGRDTMVVFTRSRMPRTGERVTLSGSISTGWLDGAPRQAVFETPGR